MRRWSLATCALLLAVASPAWAANGNIGLFFDPGASLCNGNIPCGYISTLYVFALLQGSSQFGITGAEYKVQTGANSSPDPGWMFMETFDPTATVIGTGAFNPVDGSARGVNVSWASCQIGDGTKVLIETVDILNAGCLPGELLLKVIRHDTYSNEYFQCPLFVMCDAPVYTMTCLGSNLKVCQNRNPPFAYNSTCSTSGEAYINSSRNCTVGVEPRSWAGVKELYR